MLESLEITNFRGIRNCKIEGAKRINILVGPNGSGKTSFLEGLFFAVGGNPELLVRTKAWRGSNNENLISNATSSGVVQALWSFTFRDTGEGPAKFRILDYSGNYRTIEIRQEEPETSFALNSPTSGEIKQTGLAFHYSENGEETTTLRPRLEGTNVQTGLVPNFLPTHFMAARFSLPEAETASAYSNLRVNSPQKAQEFEEAFLREFQQLKKLDIEAPWGTSAIYGTLANGRKLPLSMISGGINHLAGILVRIASNIGSVIIIDEIENGFYHTRFKATWRMVYDLAKASNVQIFASTHSLECLQALAEALKDDSADVSFLRTGIDKNGEVEIEQMSGDMLFEALEYGEVR
jgi:predicted ATPase